MSHSLEVYKSLLPKDASENYQSTRLQCKLASYYGSSISIQPQRGQGTSMSSIVFSSSLTIADAIAAAAMSKSILKVTEFEQVQRGKRPLANSPKASGNFGWRVTSTLYSSVWRVTVVRRVGT